MKNSMRRGVARHSAQFLKKDLPRYFLLIALFAVFAVFSLLQPRFFTLTNMMDMVSTASVYMISACGLMMVLSTGDLNLATGATAGMAGAIVAKLMVRVPFDWYMPVLLLAILASVAASIISGFFNIRFGVPTFIATLAIRLLLDGCTTWLTGNQQLYSSAWGESFKYLGQHRIGGIVPLPLVIAVALSFLAYIFTERTRTGRYLYATGANINAATQVGIHIKPVKYLAFALCGLYLGIAGILWTSMANSAYIALGTELTMPVLAVAMLGATFLTPGKYNVRGIVVASLLMTAISNGVLNMGANTFVRDIVQGLILIIAVGIIAVVRPEGLPKVTFER